MLRTKLTFIGVGTLFSSSRLLSGPWTTSSDERFAIPIPPATEVCGRFCQCSGAHGCPILRLAVRFRPVSVPACAIYLSPHLEPGARQRQDRRDRQVARRPGFPRSEMIAAQDVSLDHQDDHPQAPKEEQRAQPCAHGEKQRHEPENRPKEDHHRDRKSTRLNSSHRCISYAVFCL